MKVVEWLVFAKRNTFVRAFLYICVVITLASAFLIYFREILPLLLTKWYLLAATVALSATALVNQAAGYRHLLGAQGRSLQFRSLLRIWALSNLLNYLGPFQPGTIARSAILKKCNVSLRTSVIASLQWAFLSISIGVFLFSLFLISLSETRPLYFGVSLLVASILWFALGNRVVFWLARCKKKSVSESDLLTGLARSLRIGPAHFFTLIQYLILTVVYFMLYRSFSSEVNMIDALGIAALIPISTVVSITPNGVGVIESLIGYFSFQFQLNVPEGLFVVLVTRASHVLVCVGILGFCRANNQGVHHVEK